MKENSKKEKSKKQKLSKAVKVKSNKSYLPTVIGVLAVVSLVLLGWVFNDYLTKVMQINKEKASVDTQIDVTGQFSYSALQSVQGATGENVSIQRGMTEFENSLKLQKNGLGARDREQVESLKQVESQWVAMKSYLNEILNSKDAIESVKSLSPAIDLSAREIKQLGEQVNASLDEFQDTQVLNQSLTALIMSADKISSSVQRIFLGGSEAASSMNGLGDEIGSVLDIQARINRETGRLKALAYAAPNGQQDMGKLQAKIEEMIIQLANLTAYIPQYIQVSGSASAIDSEVKSLRGALYELKSGYNIDNNNSSVFGLPIGHKMLMGILGGTVVLLAITWVILKNLQQSALRREADRLRIIAEERNKSDQEAILRLMDELANLSDGDLTVEAQVTEDFTGAIADSVNFAVESMRDMVGTITGTSKEIERATMNTGEITRVLSVSSDEQSRQIRFSHDTVAKMADSLSDISNNTDASVQIARSSVDIAKEGRNLVKSTVDSMNNIRENIQDTAKRIKRLGESSQEIGDIVEIIKGIADQTNVLALNAAIQATTAGEAGRGFAVVADEVQRLAERSANATKRIEVLVKTIQADANEAVSSMETSTSQVVGGASVAENAGQSLDKIESVSQNLANLIINVSQATKNAAGMAQGVSGTMDRLTEINEQTIKEVTTAVGSIDKLRELSASLKQSVSGFKLPH